MSISLHNWLLVRACFHRGKVSLVRQLPFIPSHPGRESLSYISLQIACSHEKLQSLARGPSLAWVEGPIALKAGGSRGGGRGTTFFYGNTLAVLTLSTRDRSKYTKHAWNKEGDQFFPRWADNFSYITLGKRWQDGSGKRVTLLHDNVFSYKQVLSPSWTFTD